MEQYKLLKLQKKEKLCVCWGGGQNEATKNVENKLSSIKDKRK